MEETQVSTALGNFVTLQLIHGRPLGPLEATVLSGKTPPEGKVRWGIPQYIYWVWTHDVKKQLWDCIIVMCVHRFSGFGERCDRLTRLTVHDSFSLWQAHLKYHYRGLRSLKAWMASRSSRSTAMIVQLTDCHRHIHGIYVAHQLQTCESLHRFCGFSWSLCLVLWNLISFKIFKDCSPFQGVIKLFFSGLDPKSCRDPWQW